MFNGIGRHTLEHVFRVIAHHIIRLTVYMDFKTAAAIYLNVIFAVHCYQRYFTKHFHYGIGLRVRIVFDVIFNFVYIHLYQWLLSNDFYTFQFVSSLGHI